MLTSLFLRFGYGLIFVAAAFEGDAALISGAFLARRGYFSLPLVTLVAAFGTIAGNQLYYWIGRRSSASSRLPAARLLEKAEKFRAERGYAPPYWELLRLAREVRKAPYSSAQTR